MPERAEYIRVIMAELTRLQNHTCLIGFFVQDMGALGTPMMYAFREREKILDLFESVSGARMMCNYMRFGGVPLRCHDRMAGAGEASCRTTTANSSTNSKRCSPKRNSPRAHAGRRRAAAGHWPSTPPSPARCSAPPASITTSARWTNTAFYSRFDFKVPVGEHGDVYDRYMMRVLEMRESIKILQQALRDIPAGPVMDPKAKLRGFRPKPGEAYGRIEAPKGELGFYLISDGSPNPYRYRVRPPSFINLTILEDMCLGHRISDAVVILGSVDIVLGEVDR